MSRSPQPRIERAYDLKRPEPIRVEIHHPSCRCALCNPDQRLTANDLGLLAIAGAITGTVIAFLYDAAGALDALRATVGL